ncbi:FRG domain-containing protein [Kribbella sindirgiensis]|uniref:FRG domain-containing protein n=1 Tax=Kribbella sindirgiensis TaxID=1124744 RepID=A0A4R0I5U6_9ACTN|nr:FRG domain-containing protein [Kribbella sindirgiensis]TCC26324.1 FRG domain-containing protein [Kribbella sindirgiensis]
MTEIGSIGELVEAIERHSHGQMRPLWFRGQHDASWSVAPSIWRPRPHHGPYSLPDERNFTHRFRTRAAIRYPNTPSYDDHAGWLSLMQHYGLPTRLLDWSRSPLVAAYFAIERYLPRDQEPFPPVDAAIWILAPHDLNRHVSHVDVTPSIASGECSGLLGGAFREKDDADLHRRPDRVLAAMASETDIRMFVQQGCFTIHSPDYGVLNHLEDAPIFLEKLVIPRSAVWQFARQVEICGYRPGDIYPDLEHLASELRGQYPPGSVHGTKGMY